MSGGWRINCPGSSPAPPVLPQRRSNEKCHWRPPPLLNRITTEYGAPSAFSPHVAISPLIRVPAAVRRHETTPFPYQSTYPPGPKETERACPSNACYRPSCSFDRGLLLLLYHCYRHGKCLRDHKLFTAI